MKKDSGNFVNFSGVDPHISKLIDSSSSSKAGDIKSDKQRKKAAKDRARNRRMIDMPPSQEIELGRLADELGVPFSSLVVYLLDRALDTVPMADLLAARVPTRSMRFTYVLPYEEKANKKNKRMR